MQYEDHDWAPPSPPSAVQAHIGWRLIGRILDSVNMFAVIIGLSIVLGITVSWWAGDAIAQAVGILTLIGWLFLSVHWEATGGSPLRKVAGIYIVDFDSHQPIGYARAVGRIIVRFISSLAFGLGFLWMLWDQKKQTWHDKATNSTVIVKRR